MSGRHSIEIRADGYQPAQDDIAVAAGRAVTYRSPLTRAPRGEPRATSCRIRGAEDVLCHPRLLRRRHPSGGGHCACGVRPAARHRSATLTISRPSTWLGIAPPRFSWRPAGLQ